MRVWRHGEAFGRGNMVVRSECRCAMTDFQCLWIRWEEDCILSVNLTEEAEDLMMCEPRRGWKCA